MISGLEAAPMASVPRLTINPATLVQGLQFLTQQDPVLAQVYAQVQTPPLWLRPPGLATLVQIILEQQVSLASAQAIFNRLQALCQPFTAEQLLALTPEQWRCCGVSRPKQTYIRHLATAIWEQRLNLEALKDKDDQQVYGELTQIRGIGAWTANIYLLMALGRPDVWPTGDLALEWAVQQLYGLPAKCSVRDWSKVTAPWRPWRAVAARLLWHYYLQCRR
ncbi:MAG: hypothetical protein RMI89_04620 [Gloeomargarita sp. SKYBB_i_bin120]|nr:hypothetical protein [Gloeomargarita sp. SKYG98]MCS7292244.1 hypothetical protein [Gloeomargarita sp. SKYB120]MDW8177805.1 hypothetical protein [Gloeomargarita sp. SKYBB_i_bin120]